MNFEHKDSIFSKTRTTCGEMPIKQKVAPITGREPLSLHTSANSLEFFNKSRNLLKDALFLREI